MNYSNRGMLCNYKEGQFPIDERTAFPWGKNGLQGVSNDLWPFQSNGTKVMIP